MTISNYAGFILNNLLTALLCLNIAHFLFKKEGVYFRMWVSFCFFPILILLGTLILGVLGIYNAVAFSIVLFLLTVLVNIVDNELAITIFRQIKTIKIFQWAILFSLIVLCTFLLEKDNLKGTTFDPDRLGYHCFYSGTVIQSQSVLLPKIWLQDFFPCNAELFSTWFMLTFQNDTYVFLAGFFWFLLGLSTVFHLIFYQTRNIGASLCGVLLVGMSHPIVAARESFSSVDMAGAVMILISIVFLLYHVERSPNKISVFLVLAGLAAGYACGCKTSFILVSVFLPILAIVSFRDKIKKYLLTPIGFVVCMIPTCGFWYIRNFIETRNPLFPAQVAFFDGPLEKSYLKETTLFYQLSNSVQLLDDWKHVLDVFTDWPVSLFVFSLSGYIIGLILTVNCIIKQKHRALMLIFLTGIFFFINHLFMPYSGTSRWPEAGFRVEVRFIYLCFLLGIIMFFNCLSIHRWFKYISIILCAFVILLSSTITLVNVIYSLALCAGIVMAPYIWKIIERELSFVTQEFNLLSILLGILVALSLAYPSLRNKVNKRIFNHVQEDISVGRAWKSMEDIPSNSRIAWFGSPYHYRRYPYFGRSLQLKPVLVYRDGSAAKKLNTVWKESNFLLKNNDLRWFDCSGAPPEKQTFVNNLLECRIEYVVVIKTANQEWPVQKEILDLDRRCEVFSFNECSVIYRIL